ncbi:uncharacterized protein PpBr36_05819 [Pyricularia pennisetigena]|uniref:uncharacterized protein n=1 Tax=Pyricularia pennisetigena TaxID=1578925 RepID=UPI00114E5341|nr:uncharacterized protein PpBr36_05819 [Pyricularia pennisetigena]TLS23495.1 hypothetical protein PpBr36_05819 [Pyricularia pennisetigena]
MTTSTPITIFTVHCGNKQFLDMEPNAKFQVDGESCAIVDSWSNPSTSATTIGTEERTPVPPSMPFLQITTAHKCKSKSSWMFVFGRDENTCDIRLLGDRHDGISKRQFGIEIDLKYSTLIMKNLSRNTTRVVSRRIGYSFGEDLGSGTSATVFRAEPWGEIPEHGSAVRTGSYCEKSLAAPQLWHNPTGDFVASDLGVPEYPTALHSLADTEPWGEIPEPYSAVTALRHNSIGDVEVADLGIEFGEGPVDPELRRYNSPADLFNPLTSGSAAREAIDWRWRHSGQHTQFNTVQVAEAERIFPATKENAYISRNFQLYDHPQQQGPENQSASATAQEDEDAGTGSRDNITSQADAVQAGQVNGQKASDYAILHLNNKSIVCIPSKQTVNASQIVRSHGISRHVTTKYLSSHPEVKRTYVTGHHTVQGTYIRIADVSEFCDHLEISDLTDDIKSVLEARKYVCDFPGCKLSYKTRGTLTRHQKRHKNPEIFTCLICQKQETRKDNFASHVYRHTKNNGGYARIKYHPNAENYLQSIKNGQPIETLE